MVFRYGINDELLQALRCSHIFHEKCLHDFLERQNPNCPKCQCKAVLMENISLGTSSGTSSNNENEANSPGTPSKSRFTFKIFTKKYSEKSLVKDGPIGGIRTCFLQAKESNHQKPSTSHVESEKPLQSDGNLTIQSTRPVILVHSPSQEKSDDALSIGQRKLIPTGSATAAVCRIQQNFDDRPSVVITRQKSPILNKNRPPPPPRKPNCKTNAFPSLPEELLAGIGATGLPNAEISGVTDV